MAMTGAERVRKHRERQKESGCRARGGSCSAAGEARQAHAAVHNFKEAG